MDQKEPFYITTTLPYVNAEPHMGHAMEFIRADAIARWKKLSGYDVAFNTGTDEHGQKILKAATAAGTTPKEYADKYAAHFKELLGQLGVSEDVIFTRTTDAHHESATQEFWKRVAANGYIYKKNYQTKYCVACEEAKTESELVNGRCPLHPTLELELIDEENYFFKFSAFGDRLLALYDSGAFRVVPEFRGNEMREFIKRGLIDFSVSRLKSKMPWGVPVPGDPDHVMYVWMDALPSYITALGWPEDAARFDRFWKKGSPIQYCGKDNTRFQAVMWQAMLMAAGLPPTHAVVVNGFVTGEGGIKMSKSLGNVVNPVDVINEYGTDALRYFVCKEISSFEDSPFSMAIFKDAYNAGLANGLGNLVSRVMKMAQDNLDAPVEPPAGTLPDDYTQKIDAFDIQGAASIVWKHIAEADGIIQSKQPFKLVKTDKAAAQEIIGDLAIRVYMIGRMLDPIMPETSAAIKALVKANKMPAAPLFLRK